MAKPHKLTDTHLMLLSGASQREDRLLTCPETLTGKAAKAAAAKLLAGGLVEEVTVGADDPHWLQDEEGQPIGLKVTSTGLEAIGIAQDTVPSPSTGQGGPAGGASSNAPSTERQDQPSSASPSLPRAGTKRALVVELLSREQGASIGELTTATGWLPHTTRAALTGLRQSGYAITRCRGEDNRVAYRIGSQQAEPQAAADAVADGEV
ncbi:MAG TPA: DUF3489 domain-containing protein [Microvirga sp.]|jgi:hypothetical protein|nr:DUF3489 domain-containing protein [Microvirga sp.]